nr:MULTISPECIES: hypothetical protein [Burkholderia]
MNEVVLLPNTGFATPHDVNAVPELLPPPKDVPGLDDPDGEHNDRDPLPFDAACAIASTDTVPPPTPAITATAAVTDERIVEFAFDLVRIRAVSGAAAHVPVVAFQTVRYDLFTLIAPVEEKWEGRTSSTVANVLIACHFDNQTAGRAMTYFVGPVLT